MVIPKYLRGSLKCSNRRKRNWFVIELVQHPEQLKFNLSGDDQGSCVEFLLELLFRETEQGTAQPLFLSSFDLLTINSVALPSLCIGHSRPLVLAAEKPWAECQRQMVQLRQDLSSFTHHSQVPDLKEKEEGHKRFWYKATSLCIKYIHFHLYCMNVMKSIKKLSHK